MNFKTAIHIIGVIAHIVCLIGGAGAFVGIMPLAIIAPEHGESLVRVQATGACVFFGAIGVFIVLGTIAAFLEKLRSNTNRIP